MTKRTIADEAQELYDLATLLAIDAASRHVVNEVGERGLVMRVATIRETVRRLCEDISASELGALELPDRACVTSGCGKAVEAMIGNRELLATTRVESIADAMLEGNEDDPEIKEIADHLRETAQCVDSDRVLRILG